MKIMGCLAASCLIVGSAYATADSKLPLGSSPKQTCEASCDGGTCEADDSTTHVKSFDFMVRVDTILAHRRPMLAQVPALESSFVDLEQAREMNDEVLAAEVLREMNDRARMSGHEFRLFERWVSCGCDDSGTPSCQSG